MTVPPPRQVHDVCKIFKQYPSWYWVSQQTQKKWGVPIHVQMAIMHQESRFRADAKPERQQLLGFIPWTRPSSSYGYSQALDTTWAHYKRSTGKKFVSRDKFADASDFVGWYIAGTRRKLKISSHNTYQQYLAYHEGRGGYARKTYKKKGWLIKVAKKVSARAALYKAQLARCHTRLPKKPWYL